MLKRCGRCHADKPLTDYTTHPNARGPGKPKTDSYCKPCRAEYGREHYVKNKRRYIEKAAERSRRVIAERMLYIVSYLREHPCVDCGETDVVVLEFDHLREKEFGISVGITHYTWTRVLAEIEKCEVVCANCHRRRTAKRSGFRRLALGEAAPELPLFPPQ